MKEWQGIYLQMDETGHSRENKPIYGQGWEDIFIWTVEHIFPQGKNIPKNGLTWLVTVTIKAEEIQENGFIA